MYFFFQLFDIERAEMYLSVLRQLGIMDASALQHRKNVLQTCLPRLINHSLKVLQEPSQQVRREIFKLQTPVRNFIISDCRLNYLALIVLCFLIRSSLWETRWLERLLWHPWLWYAVSCRK